MARMADGIVYFDDDSFATLAELTGEGETVSALGDVVAVFAMNGKTFQSDGSNQTAVDPTVSSQLSTLESRKAIFMPGVLAARAGA